MKKKVTNHSLIILGFVVTFGLIQAWREDKAPFAFSKNTVKESNHVSKKITGYHSKKDYSLKL